MENAMQLLTEQWRPVSIGGYGEHYEVSSLGRVRRTSPSCRPGGYGKPGRILKPDHDARGYAQVALYADGIKRREKVYRLVAGAFIPKSAEANEVNHLDGDKRNNVVANLEWTTRSGNQRHASSVLGRGVGAANGRARLTENEVRIIRDRATTGDEPLSDIANDYSVTATHVAHIRDRKVWRHVA